MPYAAANPTSASFAAPRRRVAPVSTAIAVPWLLGFGIGAFAVLASFSGTEGPYNALGKVAIVATLVSPAVFYALALAMGKARAGITLTWVIPWCVLAATLWPRVPLSMAELLDWAPLIQVSLIGLFVVSASGLAWSASTLRAVATGATCWCGLMALYLVGVRPELPFQGYFLNPNPLGAEAGLLAGVALLACIGDRRVYPRVVLCGVIGSALLVVFATQSRSALVSIVAGGGVWFVWPLIAQKRWRHNAAFIATGFGIAMFVLGQTLVVEWLTNSGWQDWSRAMTGKNLGTRVLIWQHMLDAIGDQPWWGHGPTASPADVLGRDLSAHNLYLQVAFQSGLVGCVALAAALAAVWRAMWAGRADPVVRLAAAVMIGVLVHQSFEVTLTQNHVALACPAWLVMAIGASRSCNPSSLSRSRAAATSKTLPARRRPLGASHRSLRS